MPHPLSSPGFLPHFRIFLHLSGRFNRFRLEGLMRLSVLALACLMASPAFGEDLFDSGKLLATGGVSQIEGAGGGGLASWAMITG
jgi:hypothetical protein